MQEITVLLKTLHELEFIVAYHKHLIACASSSTTSCDRSSVNLKEFYRVYSNIKNLTCVLRNGFWKLYAENCKLKEINHAHHRNLTNGKKQRTRNLVKAKKMSSSLSMSNFHQNDRYGYEKYDFVECDIEFGATGKTVLNGFLQKYEAKPIVCVSQQENQSKKKSFHSSSSLSTHSLSSSTLSSSSSSSASLTKSASSQALVHSSPITTTIAQAIEETEARLGLNKQRPFNYLHNKINTNSNKSENLNVDIDFTNINTASDTKNDSSFFSSLLRKQTNTNENSLINNKHYLISYPTANCTNDPTVSPSSTSNMTTCSSVSLPSSLISKTRKNDVLLPIQQLNNKNNNHKEPESFNFFNFNSYVSNKAVKASPYFFNLNSEMTNMSMSHQHSHNSTLLCNFITDNIITDENNSNKKTCNVINKELGNSSEAFFFKKVSQI